MKISQDVLRPVFLSKSYDTQKGASKLLKNLTLIDHTGGANLLKWRSLREPSLSTDQLLSTYNGISHSSNALLSDIVAENMNELTFSDIYEDHSE